MEDVYLRVLTHPLVTRLKGISLSSVPWRYLDFGHKKPNRYEHSVGVSELVNYLHYSFDEYKEVLRIAGLFHDIGSPPFNHISDEYMEEKYGVDHELRSIDLIMNSELKDILDEYGILKSMIAILQKKNNLSEMLFGTIDLDNIDNLHRFCTDALGLSPPYDKVSIVKEFLISDGKIIRPSKYYDSWKTARVKVYSSLENSHSNLSSWAMLKRALDICVDDLDDNYFMMNDMQASEFIRKRVPEIVNHLESHQYYDLVFKEYIEWKPKMSIETRKQLCDEISEKYGKKKYEVCILTAEDKKSKDVKRWIVGVYSKNGFNCDYSELRKIFEKNL